MLYQVQIFQGYRADEKFNQWAKDHTSINIVDLRFSYDKDMYYTIMILYTIFPDSNSE